MFLVNLNDELLLLLYTTVWQKNVLRTLGLALATLGGLSL